MSKIVCRIEKKKSVGEVKSSLKHNFRDKDASANSLSNVDLSKSHLNQSMYFHNVEESFNYYAESISKETQRKNAVYAIEYVFTAENIFFADMTTDEIKDFFNTSIELVKSEMGEKNIISAVLHFDESTPHVQIITMPLDSKNKLNFKAFYKNAVDFVKLQDKAGESFKQYGLERGTPKRITQAEHKNFRQFQKEVLFKKSSNELNYKETAVNVLDIVKNMGVIITKSQKLKVYNQIRRKLKDCQIHKSQLDVEENNKILKIELRKKELELKLETEFKNKIKKELKEVKTENNDLKNQIRLSKELVEKSKKENEELKKLSQKYDFINAAIEKAKVLEKKDQEQKQIQEQEQKKFKNIRSM